MPQPMQRPIASPTESTSLPDYSQATPRTLRRAQAREITHLITADIGHLVLNGIAFASSLYRYLQGEDVDVEWDPDVTGKRPDLDEKERQALEHLQAIWREMTLRRSVRQRLRNR